MVDHKVGSSGGSPAKGAGKGKRVRKQKEPKMKPRISLKEAVAAVKPHVEKIARLKAMCSPPTGKDEKGWMLVPGVDAKIAAADLAAAEAELKSVITVLRQGIGYEPISLVLPVGLAIPNTAANLSQFVTNVDVTACPEWSSLQALFDEYRWCGADVKLVVNSTATANVGINTGMFGIAYAPTDAAVPSSISTIAQENHHRIFAMPSLGGSTVTTVGAVSSYSKNEPFDFHFRVKNMEALTVSSTGAISYSPGTWKNLPSGGANAAFDGTFKYYWENGVNSTSNGIASQLAYYHIEFRSRV